MCVCVSSGAAALSEIAHLSHASLGAHQDPRLDAEFTTKIVPNFLHTHRRRLGAWRGFACLLPLDLQSLLPLACLPLASLLALARATMRRVLHLLTTKNASARAGCVPLRGISRFLPRHPCFFYLRYTSSMRTHGRVV